MSRALEFVGMFFINASAAVFVAAVLYGLWLMTSHAFAEGPAVTVCALALDAVILFLSGCALVRASEPA